MAKRERTSGTFKKGDPRINRKGRPPAHSFDQLRQIALGIANEEIETKLGRVRIVDAILHKWAASPTPTLQMKFIAIAYGEVPAQVNLGLTAHKRLIIEDAP